MNITSIDISTNQPSHSEIAARAYELFQQRGCRHGSETEDWLKAESELLELATLTMSDSLPVVTAKKRKVTKSNRMPQTKRRAKAVA
jgi:hypothetical protein